MVFYPLAQSEARSSGVLHVRTAAGSGTMLAGIRRAILSAGPDALITEVRTIPQVLQEQFRQERMFSTLSTFLAVLALVLGAIGLYGALTYRIGRRTAEIGVRMALGAQRRDVLWLVLRESVLILAAGAMAGIPAALAATRLIQSLLFGLEPWDSPTLTGALAILFAAGAIASYLPARRAAAIEPIAALRSD
jgi:ABC-type antimicrobial peptide transport system permease subunit